MKILSSILPIMTLFAMLFGCDETSSKPKGWQKAKQIADNLDHPNALAADDKFIYFVTGGTVASMNEGTNNIMKMPVGGGAPIVLFKGGDIIPDSNALALDDDYVYFSANGLRRVPKAGGEAQLLTNAFMAWEIMVDKENVYWMPYVGEGMPPAPIYAVSKTGGEPKKMTDPRPSANGLHIDDKYLYWIQTDGIYRTGKQGGNIEKVYTMPAGKEIASDLKTDADNFYFQYVIAQQLMKVPKSGGEATLLAKDVSKFWVGDQDIVFERRIRSMETAIMKIGKNGGAESQIDEGGYVADMTLYKNKIFMSNIAHIYEVDK